MAIWFLYCGGFDEETPHQVRDADEQQIKMENSEQTSDEMKN